MIAAGHVATMGATTHRAFRCSVGAVGAPGRDRGLGRALQAPRSARPARGHHALEVRRRDRRLHGAVEPLLEERLEPGWVLAGIRLPQVDELARRGVAVAVA